MRNGVADIETSSIICDPRCQSRVGIDLALVQEYADDIQRGEALPLVSTIKAEEGYYLYDGFHRLEASRIAGQSTVRVKFEDGNVWDAIERSCAVNTTHGKRRAPEDTIRAVETILKVMEHRGEKWSQGEIAERCAITQPRVSQILRDNPSYKDLYDGSESFTLVRRRNGVAYEMDTRNIGKRSAGSDPDADDDDIPEVPSEVITINPWDLAVAGALHSDHRRQQPTPVQDVTAEATSAIAQPRRSTLTLTEDSPLEDQQRDLTISFGEAYLQIFAVLVQTPERIVEWWIDGALPQRKITALDHLWTPEGVREVARSLAAVADVMEDRGRAEFR